MANVNINLNFIATGNFAALGKQIAGVGKAAAKVSAANTKIAAGATAAAGAAGAAAAVAAGNVDLFANSTVRARGPLELMNRAIERQRVGLATLGRTLKVSRTIITQHIITVRAQRQAYLQAAGGAKVSTQAIMQKVSVLKIASMQVRMLNTLMVALGRTMIRVGKNIQWAGRQIMVGIGIPLAILGTLANRAAEDFSREMTRVVKVTNFTAESGTVAFEKQEESVVRQTKAIAQLGASMGFLAEESARTVAEFAQMGFLGRSLDAVSTAALELSFTAGADLDTAIQMTRIAAQAFNVDLKDLTETFARLNLVENNTALSMKELAIALPVVAGVANGVGLSIEQTSGFLAIMKENGISAKEGATALRTGLIRLVQEATDPARDAFQMIGIDLEKLNQQVKDEGGDIMIFFDALGNRLATLEKEGGQAAVNDFTAAIGKLTGTRQAARFLGLVDEIPNMIRASEVANKALTDALDEGADFVTAMAAAKDAMNEASDGLADTAGARAAIAVWTDSTVALAQYEREQRAIAESAAGIAKRLRAEINIQLATIGENTLEIANKFREFFLRVLTAFNNLGEGTKRAILMFSVFALGLGAVIMTMGLLLNMFGNITSALFSLLPGLRGKNRLMTEGQAAEVAATQALNQAISSQNLLLKNNIMLKKGQIPPAVANTGATAANTVAIQTNSLATQVGTVRSRLWAKAKVLATGATTVHTRAIGIYTKTVDRHIASILLAGKSTTRWTRTLARLKGALAVTGRALTVFGRVFRVVFMTTGIGAIVVVIGAIIIALSDLKSAFQGFSSVTGGSLQRIVDIFRGLFEIVRRTFGGFKDGADDSADAAHRVGEIVGGLVKAFVSLVEIIVDRFGPLVLTAVEAVSDALIVIVNLLNGDFTDAWENAGNLVTNFGRNAVNSLGAMFRPAIDWASQFENKIGDIASKWSDDLGPPLTETAELIGELNRLMAVHEKHIDESVSRQEDLNKPLKDAQQIREDLVRQGIISNDITLEQAKLAEILTDEQLDQLIIAEKYPEIIAGANQVLATQTAILDEIRILEEAIQAARTLEGVDGTATRRRLVREREDAAKRLAEIGKEHRNYVVDALAGLEKYRRPIRDATGRMEDLGREADEFADALEKGTKEAEKLVNLLRQAVGSLQTDIVSAVNRIYRAQSDSIKQLYDDMEEMSKGFFRKFMDDRTEALRRIREDIESNFAREIEHIEEVERLEIDRLEAVKKEMEDQERMRERFFAAEQRRIDFLSGREIAGLQTAEALARGDITGAAVIRIQQEATERQFVMDLLDEERKTFFDLKIDQINEEIKQAEEIKRMAEEKANNEKDLALDAADAAEDAYQEQADAAEEAAQQAIDSARKAAEEAQESEEIRIRNYLRRWQEVTPATEEEYRKHLAKLNKFLDKSGVRMSKEVDGINKRLNKELKNISDTFGVETDHISKDLRRELNNAGNMSVGLMQHIDNVSAQSFNSVANSALTIAEGFRLAFVSSEALTNEFLRWFEQRISAGFNNAANAALRRLLEDNKWAKAGAEAGRQFAEAFDKASESNVTNEWSPEHGMNLPDLPSGLSWGQGGLPQLPVIPYSERTPFENLPTLISGMQWGQGGLPAIPFAKGGVVTRPIFPALVGESGPEAIIPLKQIDGIFNSLIDKQFMKPFQGMMVKQTEKIQSSGGDSYNLSFHIHDANIDEEKLAKKVMFEIDKSKRNTGGGRVVRMSA